MPIPRFLYFYVTAFLVECGLLSMWIAEPLFAMNLLAASDLALGMIGMFNSAGYALVALGAGWLSDRVGRRRLIAVGLASQVVIGLALPRCHGLWLFVALAMAHTALLGFHWAPFMGLFSESTPPGVLSKALGRWNMSWCIGGLVGSWASGHLYDWIGPAGPFWFGAAFSGLALLILVGGRPALYAGAKAPPLVRHPQAQLFMRQGWLVLTSNFFVVSLLVYIFPRLAEAPHLRLGAGGIANLHALRQVGMLLAFALMGVTTGWHFRQFPIWLCFLLMVIMMALTASAGSPWMLALPFTTFGAATGIAYCLSAYYSMLSPVSKGSLIGVHEAVLSLGSTLGPVFGGWVIYQTGRPEMPFYLGLIPLALLAGGVLLLRVKPDACLIDAPDIPVAPDIEVSTGSR